MGLEELSQKEINQMNSTLNYLANEAEQSVRDKYQESFLPIVQKLINGDELSRDDLPKLNLLKTVSEEKGLVYVEDLFNLCSEQISLNPGSPSCVYRSTCGFYEELGFDEDFSKYESVANRALEKFPDDADICLAVGEIYLRRTLDEIYSLDDFTSASEHLEKGSSLIIKAYELDSSCEDGTERPGGKYELIRKAHNLSSNERKYEEYQKLFGRLRKVIEFKRNTVRGSSKQQ